MTTAELIDRGEAAKVRGMQVAAARRGDRIAAGKVALIEALLRSPDGTATTDDAVDDPAAKWPDGGRWRGSVALSLAAAGIIAADGVVRSVRPSRHRGYLTRWRLLDRAAAEQLATRLRAMLAAANETGSTVAAAEPCS